MNLLLTTRRTCRVPVALAALFVLWPGEDLAAKQKETPKVLFEGTLEALEVQVPVTVVTKEGEPIRDLAIADFEIIDGGRKQEIQRFEKIDLDAIEPGWVRTEVEEAVPAAARRNFLLLFDLSFSAPAAVSRAREAARRFVINALHPTDLVGVAAHTVGAAPKLLVTFTPDRAQVARAIDIVGAPQLVMSARSGDPLSFTMQVQSEAGGVARSTNVPFADEQVRADNPEVRAYQDVINQRISDDQERFDRGRIETWSHSLEQLARAMSTVSGRKYVVYFSEGFDGRLLYGDSQSAIGDVAGQQLSTLEQAQFGVLDTDNIYGSSQSQSAVERMLREFRRSDCIVEVVDISSLDRGAQGTGGKASKGALFYMANATGGEVHENVAKLDEELRVLLRRTAVTYLLSYQPARLEPDGSYRRLKIKADVPPGARLTHREGYYAPRPFDELHPLEKSLLAAEAITSASPRNDVAMNVLAAPFRAGESGAYVPVVIEIDGRSLVFEHQGPRVPVEIYAYASDQNGEMKDFFSRALAVELKDRREVFAGTGLKYYGHLELDSGSEYMLRILVRNASTGRTGVHTAAISVPLFGEHDPVVLPPFFIEATPQWFMVREKPDEGSDEGWVVYPFTLHGSPFVPAARPVLKQGEQIRLCMVTYNLGVEDLELDARILDADGSEVEGGRVELIERISAWRDGVDQLVVELATGGLKTGTYQLQLGLLDPTWGSTEPRLASFVVAD